MAQLNIERCIKPQQRLKMLERKMETSFLSYSMLTFVYDNFHVSESLSLSQTNANSSESSLRHSAALVLKLAGVMNCDTASNESTAKRSRGSTNGT